MFDRFWTWNNNGIIIACDMVADYSWNCCYCNWDYVAIMLNEIRNVLLVRKVDEWMKVVVKKSPKFLRGFLKLIFGIKST